MNNFTVRSGGLGTYSLKPLSNHHLNLQVMHTSGSYYEIGNTSPFVNFRNPFAIESTIHLRFQRALVLIVDGIIDISSIVFDPNYLIGSYDSITVTVSGQSVLSD